LALDAELRKYWPRTATCCRQELIDRQADKDGDSLKEVLALLAKAEEKAGKAEGDRTQVEREFSAFRKAADNRFAGIDLAGDIRRASFWWTCPAAWSWSRTSATTSRKSGRGARYGREDPGEPARLEKFQLILFSTSIASRWAARSVAGLRSGDDAKEGP